MKFTHEDQAQYAKIALSLYDKEKDSITSLQSILAVGELVKKYADHENGLIFDVTEYVYERIRVLSGDERAFEDIDQRKRIDDEIKCN